jgi:hypothetical protein
MADQSVAAKPVSQAAAGAEQSVFNDPITGLPIPKVPQAPPLDPEAALQQISLGQVAAAQLKQAVMAPATLRLEADSSPVTVATSEPHHVQALMSETVIAEAVAILDSVKAPKKRGRPRKNA